MLAPEVWNLHAPSDFTSFKQTLSQNDIFTFTRSAYYSHMISVVLPCSSQLPTTIENSMKIDNGYYKINNFFAAEIFNFPFIKYFVQNGTLSMISENTLLDCDNCIAILPNGRLIIKLRRNVYYNIGIDGKPSQFANKQNPEFYIIDIDLRSELTIKLRIKYDRYKKHLLECGLKFDVLCTWEPEKESEKCPSSIALYFSKRGYRVQSCSPKMQNWMEHNVIFPSLQQTEPAELSEFLGALLLGVKLNNEENEKVVEETNISKLTGFITVSRIYNVYSELRSWIMKNDNIPWIGMHVQGFEDTPVTYGMQEHNISLNGDNGYTIYLQHNGTSHLHLFHSSYKKLKKK